MMAASFGQRDDSSGNGHPCRGEPTIGTIRGYLRGRRARSAILGADLFADPAWDMLLELYASQGEARRISVHGLCTCSGVAATTALRWIKRLEGAGLIGRVPDAADSRRSWVRLTDEGHARMAHCLTRYAVCGASPQTQVMSAKLDVLSRLGAELVRDRMAHDCLSAVRAGQTDRAERLARASILLEPAIDPADFNQMYDVVVSSLTGS